MKKVIISLIPVAVLMSACTTTGIMPPQPVASNPQALEAVAAQGQMFQSQTIAEVNSLRERVRRVERAMIRLDRRMQLVERNELARMSSLTGTGVTPAATFQPTAFSMVGNESAPVAGATDLAQMTSPFARGAAAMSRPVSLPAQQSFAVESLMPTPQPDVTAMATMPDLGANPAVPNAGMVTAALQPNLMPVSSSPSDAAAVTGDGAVLGTGLPSLADSEEAAKDEASVAIWTISFEPEKVWPGRDQLLASREVVNALKSDARVALYARGARPASKEFRERVRALSRYLGRVTNAEDVPIAAMPAKHLDSDTIELIVAR
jgi:hypothetical protein